MPTFYRHHGSLTKMLKASTVNIPRHFRGQVRAGAEGYWRSIQGPTGQGVPRDTGATQNSAKAGTGRPSFRRAQKRYRGAHYPPRPLGEMKSALVGWKPPTRIFASVNHPGGILALNRRFRGGPRRGQVPSRKVPEGVGFHGLAIKAAQDAVRDYQQKYRPGGSR